MPKEEVGSLGVELLTIVSRLTRELESELGFSEKTVHVVLISEPLL